MDRTIAELARYCNELNFDSLPPSVVHAATERLIDTVACAIGGLECDAARAARRLSPTASPGGVNSVIARAIGDPVHAISLEHAGFLNSIMIRYLDFNDTFPGGHPSDALGPVIALADAIGASGEKLITALVAGYEIFIRFAIGAKLRELGWDQGFGIGLATAAGGSILLELDLDQTRHALAIAAVANVPLRATRAGELSVWKGTATSYAAMGAMFGTQLAAEGVTGPAEPIDGRHGLRELVTGEFELIPFNERHLTVQARIKYWPVEYHLQAAVWAGIKLGEIIDEADLESVEIETYWSAWHETGSEPEKWDPRTRETADHSMPYIFIRAFQQGELNLSAFEPDSYLEEPVRDLMKKVSVRVEDDLEAEFPDVIKMRATALTKSGEKHTVEIINPRGHEDNPVTTSEIEDKFLRLVAPQYGEARASAVLEAFWQVSTVPKVNELIDLLIVDGRD